ncbi:MAG: M48 family metalloprotease [Planctomycetes bacterium]|nr:M48 family metalloprotease [Planctomycetota bacterium]MCB9871529.1 M48 family metalloprotease [Planctomycetota bacterium]MCB9889428.1 M48 family metalloprotease [Planctomycetota bacterium]
MPVEHAWLRDGLPYLRRVRDHFKCREPELWAWFRDRGSPDALRERVRLELLKSAFRLDRADHEATYRTTDEAAAALGVAAPVTLYQAQGGESMNAGLQFVPGEAHVVLIGPVVTRLQPTELRALLGHELAHFVLLGIEDGELFTARSILEALVNRVDADPAHQSTRRRFALHEECYCDRGALLAAGGPLPVIAMLQKVLTGLAEATPESYVRQVAEVFAAGRVASDGASHPEPFVRTHALMRFAESGDAADAELAVILTGGCRFDQLDLLDQEWLTALTRTWIESLLTGGEPTAGQLAQARAYFEDFTLGDSSGVGRHPEVDIRSALRSWIGALEDGKLRDYLCYVALDLAGADREEIESVLCRGMVLCRDLGWDGRLAELAAGELGIGKRDLARLRDTVERLRSEETGPGECMAQDEPHGGTGSVDGV